MKHSKIAIADILRPLPEAVTVCATVDESGDEHIVTEFMIRRACEQMDNQQTWPCASELFTGSLRTLSKGSANIVPFRRSILAG